MTTDDRFNSLVEALDDPNTREEAIRALAGLRDARAVHPLSKVLFSQDAGHALAYRARQLAAEALGEIGDAGAVPALTAALNDASSAVKISAAQALGTLGEPRAVNPLLVALEDSNPGVRAAAAQVLGSIGQTHEIPFTSLTPLLADSEDSVRQAVTEVLLSLGTRAYDALVAALHHSNSTIRGAAANLLGELKDERARDALRRVLLDDTSQWVRSRAKWAMDQLPPSDDWPRIDRTRAPDPPADTIQLIRAQKPPEWPSLRPKPETPTSTPEPENMTAEEIEKMLDLFDVRLAKGEITEATYKRLVERWQARLRELRD